MPITRTRAFRLCTPTEYEFVRTSFGTELKRHTPTQLRQKIQRARRLRDKYADLARRQSGEVRGKRQPRGARAAASNQNTIAKAELFAEALDRFEAQLTDVQPTEDQNAAPETKDKTRRRPARARKAKQSAKRKSATDAATAASRASTQASRAARKQAQPVRSGSPKAAGHVRGRTRRNQRKRDTR